MHDPGEGLEDNHAMASLDLEDLLTRCIVLDETQGEAAVEDLLAQHPEHSERARELLASLRGAGLVENTEHRAPPLDRVGDFVLLRRIGQGGMGVVWLAHQPSVDRLVAVKIVHPQWAASSTMVERFRRESRAVGQLEHPNIVRVIDAGEEQGLVWLAMELVSGEGLDERLRRKASLRDRLAWGRDIARGLAHAHAHGVLHRDVKPSNIRIRDDGRAVLLDFGLAKIADATALTRSGGFQGSPHYAAPEQVSTSIGAIDERSDVYALGVTLYEALSGELPFGGETTEGVFHSILHRPARALRRLDPSVSRDVETVVATAMQRDPEDRYATASDFADDLDALLELRPIRARAPGGLRRLRLWAQRHRAASAALVTAILAVVILVAGLAWQRAQTRSQQLGEARELVDDATTRLERLAMRRPALVAKLEDIDKRVQHLQRNYQPSKVWLEWTQERRAARDEAEQRERELIDLIAQVERARELAPELTTAVELRSALHFERWAFARARGERDLERALRRRLEKLPLNEAQRRQLQGRTLVRFVSEPSNARIDLFRYVEQSKLAASGEARLVPLPYKATIDRGSWPVLPGSWCLRVVRPAGTIRASDLIIEVEGYPIRDSYFILRDGADARRGDRVVSVDGKVPVDLYAIDVAKRVVLERDGKTFEPALPHLRRLGAPPGSARQFAETGGCRAKIYRDSRILEVTLPKGLGLRTSAAAPMISELSRVGDTPSSSIELERGSWLAILRAPGRQLQRVAFDVGRDRDPREIVVSTKLLEADACPPGFARIVDRDDPERSFFLAEREVLMGEYFEFLNDPRIQRRIRRSTDPVLYPRDPLHGNYKAGLVERDANGRFAPSLDGFRTLPVMGINLEDVRTYLKWRNLRAERRRERYRYRLPTMDEYFLARQSGEGFHRRLVYGDDFCPLWMCTSWTKPRGASLHPAMTSPIDESAWGIFDLGGSVREWTEDAWSEMKDQHYVFGGSFMDGLPDLFVSDRYGRSSGVASMNTGFRLVAVPVANGN